MGRMSSTAGLSLIEVHAHLLPGVDDGSRSTAESLDIARTLVSLGYSQLICTPHVWPDLVRNTLPNIRGWVRDLQAALDAAHIPLKLHAGAEINLHPHLLSLDPDTLPTLGDTGTHFLVDAWLWNWEPWLTPVLRHLQKGGRTVILAHPERLGLFQSDPTTLPKLQDLGVLFQGNMYCLTHSEGSEVRDLAESLLDGGHYHLLGGDLHRLDSLPKRIQGLETALAGLGSDGLIRYLRTHPAQILGQLPPTSPITPRLTSP